jgi:quercetin 2,3-dioxygenase
MSIKRRNFLTRLGLGLGAVVTASFENAGNTIKKQLEKFEPIIEIKPMGFQWETLDPFLFCVHHEDYFPKGNDQMGPAESLAGRSLGDDFIIKNGYRMYHGKKVPGFPGHPHRGFETVTVVRKGLVDHADSMGAAGRYGNGDVQWMTAGSGVQHSEMFPLLSKEKDNPLELFQIWLNLPSAKKMSKPHFSMFWSENIPKITLLSSDKKKSYIEVIAGQFGKTKSLTPPPNSWAFPSQNEVAIWNVIMEKGSRMSLPKAGVGVNRMLYFYEGENITIGETKIESYQSVRLRAQQDVEIYAHSENCKFLILQGKPIGETVMQYGPFVMNTKEEIQKAFDDYHKTQYGGWPWPRYDQVHDRNQGRFAKYADGKIEVKG